tara:strand:+ start:887 stop:1321 length:435 start_codon:yes stop_codon:yes gene_type:complete
MGITNTEKLAKKYHLTLSDTARMVEDWQIPFHVTGTADLYLLESKTFEREFIENGLKINLEWKKEQRAKDRKEARRSLYDQERQAIARCKDSKVKKQLILGFKAAFGGKAKRDYSNMTWEEREADIKKRRAANIKKHRHTPEKK